MTPAVKFNPKDPDFIRDPYPTYDRLRSAAPIFYHEETGLWWCTRYEDVNTLLRDRRFGRALPSSYSHLEDGAPTRPAWYRPFLKLGENSMFDMEPPDHTRLRALVQKAFTPRRVRALGPRIQAIAGALIDDVFSAGRMDLLQDFAEPLPVTVIAELLGVPQADRHKLRPWSRDIVAMYELDHSEETARRAVRASREFSDYLHHLAQRRRRDPRDDLITALVFAEEEGDRLSEDELVSTAVLLLNAGHEATVNVIGNGFYALFRHPEQLARLRADASLVTSAVEEMMRYDTPLQLFRRWVREDLTYAGIALRAGMQLGLAFGAANRDPQRFPDPHRFDVVRPDNDHISFGAGVHYCLGAPLARLELQIAVRTLLQRLPNLHLADPEPQFRDAYVIRGLQSLPVAW